MKPRLANSSTALRFSTLVVSAYIDGTKTNTGYVPAAVGRKPAQLRREVHESSWPPAFPRYVPEMGVTAYGSLARPAPVQSNASAAAAHDEHLHFERIPLTFIAVPPSPCRSRLVVVLA